ncbi:MAG: fatty acid hydroxylase, partial [Solirubrobacterales bacterium]|nr:fatty acid hydroxylase [Solirubrobacterales bacterium]
GGLGRGGQSRPPVHHLAGARVGEGGGGAVVPDDRVDLQQLVVARVHRPESTPTPRRIAAAAGPGARGGGAATLAAFTSLVRAMTDVQDPPYTSRTEQLRASPPIFASPWMDRFTRVHPSVVPALFVPIILAFAVFALRDGLDGAGFVGWLLAGYLVWTLSEYWLHRVVFHFEPESGLGARLHWMIHGVHHDHPNDPLRLVMPPSASIPLGSVFVLLFQLLLPFGSACALAAGFFAGYLAYDMVHYAVHHRAPRGPIARKLRELHMRHHFQDETTAFGISAPWWDVVFRTSARSRRG